MDKLSTAAVAQIAELNRSYRASLPEKRQVLDTAWDAVLAERWTLSSLDGLRNEVHKIAGWSSSYGLEQIGTHASALDRLLSVTLRDGVCGDDDRAAIAEAFIDLIAAIRGREFGVEIYTDCGSTTVNNFKHVLLINPTPNYRD
ncbi:MAG: Hpt domain-containing protein [Gammaproteobacteria bacterium]|nr:Hpt domain-containing protein [Gammaproteobacteria bacterium]MDH3466670.1 Hpt domain-containing protein [Gammaproteobacteria bacterium]